MKPVNGNTSMYINFYKENKEEGPKFKVEGNIRI